MIFIITSIILLILLVIVSVRLLIIKKELRKIAACISEEETRIISVPLIDEDLNQLIVQINRVYEKQFEIRNQALSKEKELRNSISIISHDMKTPLTSVIGYLQLAQKNADEKQNDIRTALERALYLNNLVNDFFEISLIDSDGFSSDMERINICELICEEIFALSPAFDKKGIVPVFENSDRDIRVYGDRKMCVRIFQNLLSNCLKYASGEIQINIDDSSSETVKINIINSPDREVDTERMFEKFYRDDEARSGDGAGLGMYICRKFTEAMNGSVSAVNQDGKLITTVCIPAGVVNDISN